MNAVQYAKARQKVDLEHQHKLRLADDEHQQKLRSLNDVWSMFNAGPPPQTIESHADAVTYVRGAWRQLVLEIISKLTKDTFTVAEIEQLLAEKHPELSIEKSSISNFLKKMCDDGELTLVEQGSGRRGSVYAKKKPRG